VVRTNWPYNFRPYHLDEGKLCATVTARYDDLIRTGRRDLVINKVRRNLIHIHLAVTLGKCLVNELLIFGSVIVVVMSPRYE